ncbi:ATP-grasp domain-containing protein [Pygmaiobacter massiliensis]|uniref:ATP-grasp domain-containing protein n=1 Tax=Pygmaiobacter massiliensis TaxID=1917873 RepID=UPI002A811F06|nr:ATP-grasp domain-containing protein [Pygmaiobacter massiliensis]MDY4784955.1 ATP-grasp domain-containing protein [Pygmaiobacter massiliensis]
MEHKQINVLITGVGAIIGYGIIKSLRNSNYPCKIIGMDIYKDAVGQHWCDEFVQAKLAAAPDYLEFLTGVIDRYQIDLVYFGTEQELYKVSRSRNELKGYEQKFVLNCPELLDLSTDKWETRRFLLEHNLEEYAIPSVITGDYETIAAQFGSEFLLKPRSSYASKGIEKVKDTKTFDFFKARMGKGFMAQKLVGDAEHEYTVGSFGTGDGNIAAMIQMRRKLSGEGATAKATTLFDLELEAAVRRIAKECRPYGPTNFQFRKDGDSYLLLEVNPRISSSTSLRAAFGYNESVMCIDWYLTQRAPRQPEVKKGSAVRYIDEVVTLL